MTALILFMLTAHAGDCDVSSLRAELSSASPVAVPEIYLKLAECDTGAAKAVAGRALDKILAGDEGNAAAVAALNVGAGKQVTTWLEGLEPDQRSRAIAAFGEACKDSEGVQAYFVDRHEALGTAFFEERWHRGLSECRTDEIQQLLTDALDDPTVGREASDTAKFFSVVEVYARNLGKGALPFLKELATSGDERVATLAVSAFGDAANVGGTDGTNPDAVAKATAILNEIGPELPPDAVNQARTTLDAMGSEGVASSFAAYRWPDSRVEGTYRYYAAATETVTCKNGKTRVYLHHGWVTEPGSMWPDEMAPQLEAELTDAWDLGEAADKCRGTTALEVAMTDAPQGADANVTEWLAPHRTAYDAAAAEAQKNDEIEHATTEW